MLQRNQNESKTNDLPFGSFLAHFKSIFSILEWNWEPEWRNLVDDEALEVDSIHSELNNFIDCPLGITCWVRGFNTK